MNVLKKTTLQQLIPEEENIFIVAIIVGNQRPRIFAETKGVWNFTVRDSPRDYINVTFWHTGSVIEETFQKFKIGDVVEIQKPLVIIRRVNDYGEQYRPMVTSPFSLTLNEHSKIVQNSSLNALYIPLLRMPTKPLARYIPLRDIYNKANTLSKGQYVDILVAVRNIKTMRSFVTKQQERINLREVTIFDHSCSGVKLTIWNPDLINRSASWQPRETILFITDINVQWSAYQKNYDIVLSSRSIITENPIGKESDVLFDYVKNAPLAITDLMDQITTSSFSNESIENVVNVQLIHEKINNYLKENHRNEQFISVYIYAIVTHLDLDGLVQITFYKCTHCLSYIKNGKCFCEINPHSETTLNESRQKFIMSLDLKMSISDHTGTLTNCQLTGKITEKVLNCNAKEFSQLTDDEKISLKWKLLMERCAIRLIVGLSPFRKPVISVVDCAVGEVRKVAQKISVF